MSQQQQAPLIAVVSQVIKSAAQAGITSSEVADYVEKHFTQWKRWSVSPQVSHLVWLGCIRREGGRFNSRLFHIRDVTEQDVKKLRMSENKKKAKSRATFKETDAGLKMLLEVGNDKTEILTVDEARSLYLQLHKIFGGR